MTTINATSAEPTPAALHDVVVVGGGPAGAAVARTLALRGRDVVLLEATSYDAPRFGETLPPECNPLLRELGVWDAFAASAALASPGTIAAWGSPEPGETNFVGNRYGNGWHVDRNAFDALLCDAARVAGACVLVQRVTRCVRDGGAWSIQTQAASGGPLAARIVVDASGRNGTRLGADDARIVDDALIAVFLVLAYAAASPADQRTLVEATPDGWWYHAPLPSGGAVAAFLTDPELYASNGIVVGEQLAHAPLTTARCAGATIASSHVVHVPSSVRAPAAGAGWVAVGDAAAAYDPLSGYGITKALRSGIAAGDAVDGALRGGTAVLSAYADDVRQAFDAYAIQRRAYYAREQRWPEREFWRNRRARKS